MINKSKFKGGVLLKVGRFAVSQKIEGIVEKCIQKRHCNIINT